MIIRFEKCARAGDELSMGVPGLRLVTRQKGPPAESSFLPKAAYKWMKLKVQFFSHTRYISGAP